MNGVLQSPCRVKAKLDLAWTGYPERWSYRIHKCTNVEKMDGLENDRHRVTIVLLCAQQAEGGLGGITNDLQTQCICRKMYNPSEQELCDIFFWLRCLCTIGYHLQQGGLMYSFGAIVPPVHLICSFCNGVQPNLVRGEVLVGSRVVHQVERVPLMPSPGQLGFGSCPWSFDACLPLDLPYLPILLTLQ